MGANPLTEASKASPTNDLQVSIAGLGVRVESQSQGIIDAILDRYQGYLTPGRVHLQLTISHHPESQMSHTLEPEAEFYNSGVRFNEPAFQGEVDMATGLARLWLTAPDPLPEFEYFLRVIYALLAFEAGGLLFHSAGILRQGRAYLFFGPSGTGKTTVARSVEKKMVMNDDLVVILPIKGHWEVYATPFWNPSQVVPAGPQHGVLEGLYRLVQSQATFVEPMGPGQAVAELVANTPILAANPSQGLALLARVQALRLAVTPQRLHLRLGDDIWPMILGDK